MEKKPFYKRWWGIALISFVALLLVFSMIGANEEKKAEEATATAKQKAEDVRIQKEIAEEKEAKKAEIDATIANFKKASEEYIAKTNGAISAVDIEHNSNHFAIRVMLDESIWASANESQKLSFATTVGTAMQESLKPHAAYIDIVSAQNGDVVATQKLFGEGWKIKR